MLRSRSSSDLGCLTFLPGVAGVGGGEGGRLQIQREVGVCADRWRLSGVPPWNGIPKKAATSHASAAYCHMCRLVPGTQQLRRWFWNE